MAVWGWDGAGISVLTCTVRHYGPLRDEAEEEEQKLHKKKNYYLGWGELSFSAVTRDVRALSS